MTSARAVRDVTLSTKCWEGDYRHLLTAEVIEEVFGPFGESAARQVVINRVSDRADAERLAAELVESGAITAYAWAEDMWAEVARSLGIPVTWFGAAWPYSAPELCELALAGTEVVVHLAGDVRLLPGAPWAQVAVDALGTWDEVAVVAPRTPSGTELVEAGWRRLRSGWTASQLFSDQCFAVRRDQLLSPEVVRAAHPIAGRYPRPGGALTFEARVGAWMHVTGHWRATDESRGYLHPVSGTEGDSYALTASVPVLLPPVPVPGAGYPPAGAVPATGIVVAHDDERTVANAVASLGWCRDVVVLDAGSSDRTRERALEAGARVRTGTVVDAAVWDDDLPWRVVIAADELVSPELATELAALVSERGLAGVRAARRALDRGAWVDDGVASLLRSANDEGAWRESRHHLVRFASAGLSDTLAQLDAQSDERATGAVFARRASGRLAAKAFFRALPGQGPRRAAWAAAAEWLWVEKAWEAAQGGPTAQQAGYDEIAQSIIGGVSPGPALRRGTTPVGRRRRSAPR